jgi:hypothetical protein
MGMEGEAQSHATSKRARNTKFHGDLAPADDRAVRLAKQDPRRRANTDLLTDAIALFRWASAERRLDTDYQGDQER